MKVQTWLCAELFQRRGAGGLRLDNVDLGLGEAGPRMLRKPSEMRAAVDDDPRRISPRHQVVEKILHRIEAVPGRPGDRVRRQGDQCFRETS
jgi:hypothetical protein